MYSGYGGSYGSGMYGGSMYGRSSYGGYGGGMYGRSSMYGGYGSSMYGNSMYGGSTYGGGMGGCGRPGADGEFWAPKQPEDDTPQPSRFNQVQNLNQSFLDSVHDYGDWVASAVRRMMNIWTCSGGLEGLRATLRSSEVMGRPVARRGTGLALVAALLSLIAWRLHRRNRRLAWERVFATAGGHLGLPPYYPPAAAL